MATRETRVYKLINPSDSIEFDAVCDEAAALAALVVGEGRFAAECDGAKVIGLALFGGDGGYQERYGRDVGDGLAALPTEMCAALASFRIVGGREPTSMNDICGYAHQCAERFAPPPAAGGE